MCQSWGRRTGPLKAHLHNTTRHSTAQGYKGVEHRPTLMLATFCTLNKSGSNEALFFCSDS